MFTLKQIFKGNTVNAAIKQAANIYSFTAKDIDGVEVQLSKYV
jgi:hypothetical protein